MRIFPPVIRPPFLFSLLALVCLAACDAEPSRPADAATRPTAPPPVMSVQPLAVPPPTLPQDPIVPSANSPANLDVSVLHLGRLVVALERTPMRDVQREIGGGVFDEQGDGGDWRTWLCYTSPHAQRVWLISTQTGSGEFVTGFVVARDATAEPTSHCPALPAQYSPVVLEPDIRLGSSQQSLERRFGASESADDWRLYRHIQSSNHDSLHFDISHWLAVQYENGQVVSIAAHKSTTN